MYSQHWKSAGNWHRIANVRFTTPRYYSLREYVYFKRLVILCYHICTAISIVHVRSKIWCKNAPFHGGRALTAPK